MRAFLVASLVVLFAFPAYAKDKTPAPPTMNFEQAATFGIANSPLASDLDSIRAETYGPAKDTTALMNPELSFEYNRDALTREWTLSQPFRLSDITLARAKYKKFIDTIDSFEERLDLLRVRQQIAISYYDLYIAQETEKNRKAYLSFLGRASGIVNKSITKNDMTVSELRALNADTLSARTDLEQAKKALDGQRMAFLQLLGMPGEIVTLQQPPAMATDAPLDRVFAALDHTPSQKKMLQLQLQQAQKQIAIANNDRYAPVVSPMIKHGWASKENQTEWTFGFSLSIPLWDHQDGNDRALKAKERALKRQIAAIDNISFEEMIRHAHKRMQSQAASANNYATKILPGYRSSVNRVEADFRNGIATILDVWQIRDKYNAAQDLALTALKDALLTKIELEFLIGSRLEDLQ